MADEVEADHGGVEVDVVLVGDCPLDAGVEALVKAVREAVVNAARHSGAAGGVGVRRGGRRSGRGVRPRPGPGLRPCGGRRRPAGHRPSIIGRMARHGGRAQVHSAPGEGTEVTLEVACQTERRAAHSDKVRRDDDR